MAQLDHDTAIRSFTMRRGLHHVLPRRIEAAFGKVNTIVRNV
jgi:hypothetical protein